MAEEEIDLTGPVEAPRRTVYLAVDYDYGGPEQVHAAFTDEAKAQLMVDRSRAMGYDDWVVWEVDVLDAVPEPVTMWRAKLTPHHSVHIPTLEVTQRKFLIVDARHIAQFTISRRIVVAIL